MFLGLSSSCMWLGSRRSVFGHFVAASRYRAITVLHDSTRPCTFYTETRICARVFVIPTAGFFGREIP